METDCQDRSSPTRSGAWTLAALLRADRRVGAAAPSTVDYALETITTARPLVGLRAPGARRGGGAVPTRRQGRAVGRPVSGVGHHPARGARGHPGAAGLADRARRLRLRPRRAPARRPRHAAVSRRGAARRGVGGHLDGRRRRTRTAPGTTPTWPGRAEPQAGWPDRRRLLPWPTGSGTRTGPGRPARTGRVGCPCSSAARTAIPRSGGIRS